MAYSKQTWTDDVSAVTGSRMTHIEQGIYDNSLATDKINPSGTATTTAEIESGQVNDVIGFKSLKLKGQTSQYTTQGNNILNIYARHPSGYTETVSGVTFTYNDDGSINANGKATADINYFLASQGQLGDDIFNGTNYLSGCTGGSLTTFFLQFWADTIGAYQQATTEVATNKTAGVNWNITIAIKNGVTIDKTFYPMMSATSGKTFEKYSGGKASPNPDFPQDVKNVSGYNVVAINGSKNLFDKDINIVTPGYLNASGAVVTSDATLSYQDRFIKVQPSTVYTISSGTNTLYRIAEYTSDKTFITRTLNANASRSYTFTTSSQTHFIKMAGTLTTVLNTLQIEKGNTATSYVAHQGNNFEINLGNNLMKTKPLVEATVNGITFTPVYDGNKLQYVNINGTSTAVATYTLQNANVDSASTYVDELSAGTYTLSDFSGSNTPNIAIFLRYTTNGSTFTTQNSVDNKTFTVSSKFKYASYIRIASGTTINNMKFYPQIEKGNRTSYAPYFPPIELCKIGIHQDYIYKKDGKWYKYKAIEKIILNGTESWVLDGALTNTNRFRTSITSYNTQNIALASNGFSNQLQIINAYSDDSEHLYTYKPSSVMHLYVFYTKTRCADLAGLQAYLSANNLIIYGILNTPIEEEITYTPLIRQLDELYNSGLYDVTNIGQDNSSEAFILDLEACKNNINGIVEYIRR